MTTAGGIKAIKSVLRYSKQIGPLQLYRALKSKNACKACAFGTGGQNGGIFNETKSGIEFCNKNIQAHLSDSRPAISQQFFLENSLEMLGELSGKSLEDLGRLTRPLYKREGDKHYSPVSYEEAIDIVLARLQQSKPERSFFYASGRSSNEAAFSLQLLARLFGTNNVNNCSYYCHQASGVGLTETIGTGTATVQYTDLEKADTLFVIGANPASNHPRYLKCLLKCRRRGGKVIVINPAKEPGMLRFASPSDWRSMLSNGEDVASHYVQPHLGGDLAFFHGVAKAIIESGADDKQFIAQFSEDYQAFKDYLEGLDWKLIESASGVEKSQILDIADIYSQSTNTIFSWSMGLTHHVHGVDNIEAVVALALLRGMVGRPGAGLMPLRGHSNIQGTGSMGFTPALKKAVETKLQQKLRLQQKLDCALPREKGLDTMACMEASAAGKMDVAIMLGGNLLASNPDTKFATQAMNAIAFKCFINPTLNLSHVQGVDGEVLILPGRARDEEKQKTTQESMFNFVRLSDGGIERFPQLWSEIDIICSLGEGLIDKDKFDFSIFRNHEAIRKFVGDVIPGFDRLTDIDHSKEEFHIGGRTLHQPKFSTSSGKARFKFRPVTARQSLDDKQFLLTSVRSEGQFNSIIYHEFDSYRDQSDRQVLMMNKVDMARLSITDGQTVNVSTTVGRLENLKAKAFDIRPGNIMTYYPEANVLVPKEVDGRSKTPGFKSVLVSLEC